MIMNFSLQLMIIIDSTVLHTLEVSVERAAYEIRLFITVIIHGIRTKLGTKYVKSYQTF